MYSYRSAFVDGLFDDIGHLIHGADSVAVTSVYDRLCELAAANLPAVDRYWSRTERGRGIPDSAFKTSPPYLFADQPPARVFHTSGTTGTVRGRAPYSPRGMELMRASILASFRRRVLQGSDAPAMVRCVPSAADAPQMVMAYGMELIAEAFGDPALSEVVADTGGVEFPRLVRALDRAARAGAPTVLIGATAALVGICEELERRGRRYVLPLGSRIVDAGGFKSMSRHLSVPVMRDVVGRVLGVPSDAFVNIFGMTELASQLYDASDDAVGPLGQRPKAGLPFVWPRVRDAHTMSIRDSGPGLLEVVDLCLIDRPPVVLTGDLAIGTDRGVAVVGRIDPGSARGCSLTLDEMTVRGGADGSGRAEGATLVAG